MKFLAYIIILLTLILVPGCDDLNKPENQEVPEEILNFVDRVELPSLRSVDLYSWGYTDKDVLFFRVEYGGPYDCPSGCFYSNGIGLKFGEKIGWIEVSDYEGLESYKFIFYDIEPSEVGLFHEVLWKEIEAKNHDLFWQMYLPMVAKDIDTPEDPLVRIAARLYGYITASLAWDLLERSDIEDYPTVLQILSCLPVFQGDEYELPRARAREILGDDFLGCNP